MNEEEFAEIIFQRDLKYKKLKDKIKKEIAAAVSSLESYEYDEREFCCSDIVYILKTLEQSIFKREE